MRIKPLYILLLMLVSGFSSCSKDEDLSGTIVDLGGESWVKGPLDDWLFDNYVAPYNIVCEIPF